MSHAHNPHADHGQVVDLLPAGAKDSHKPEHHGHTIVPLRLLVGVLVILLVFTFLTVTAANAEQWFARAFDVHIAGWVNVVVALSIACVKSVIVAMYFMQLRYDHNPMNALVCVFTIMVATFFLGFIAIDLGNRGAIYAERDGQQIPGGTGDVPLSGGDGAQRVPAGTSIAMFARQKADAEIDQALKDGKEIHNHAYLKRIYIRYQELRALPALDADQQATAARLKAYMDAHRAEFEHIEHEVHAHGHKRKGHKGNSASASRPATGITLPELSATPAAPSGGDKPAH